eukprot:2399238-Amphidinium_carterae.1
MGGIRTGQKYYLESESIEEVHRFLDTLGQVSGIANLPKREARIALLFSKGWFTKAQACDATTTVPNLIKIRSSKTHQTTYAWQALGQCECIRVAILSSSTGAVV